MLVILFGLNSEMGERSRQFFIENGYEQIQKSHYVPEGYTLPDRYAKRNEKTKEEILECDFSYENNGMIVGFNRDQIIDAVRGRTKCFLSASSNTIDFIREIKAAYGEYVLVIGTYIDDRTLNVLFHALKNPVPTEEEIAHRFYIAEQIKKAIIENRSLFDDIVMYGGEDSLFNYDSLKVQYQHILNRANRREKELNDKKYVEMPYSGPEDYIFVSYAHVDSIHVFPILRMMQLRGYRIWYDEGINGGENWRKILASKIQASQCKEFLLFSSSNSVESIHVRAEVNLALDLGKKVTTVRLDDAKFGPDMEMYLSMYHFIHATDEELFNEKIVNSMNSSTKKIF